LQARLGLRADSTAECKWAMKHIKRGGTYSSSVDSVSWGTL
jgi:hypothetical protein